MKHFTLALAFLALSVQLFAQNIVISTVNPAGLFVCGNSTVSVSVLNGAGSPAANNLTVTVTFPTGLQYQPGSVAGAVEANISNLGAPVFALPNLPGGNTATFTLTISAGCAAVQAINSGQTFSNSITAAYTGGSATFTSSFFPVETGLVNISSVSPPTINATKGDVITRTIVLKNTRQGPIQSLTFRDTHFPGLSMELVGGQNQVNTATQFTATIPGSFFTSFGDGDDLLEFDEEITLQEKVTVEDCGIPSFTNQSLIEIGWGCGGPQVCRQDSAYASVTILPTTQNPILNFIPVYAPPRSGCGQVPSIQEILIVNTGDLPATNILLSPIVVDTSFHAIDPLSFSWFDGAAWQPLPPLFSSPAPLPICGITNYALETRVRIPEVLAGDTVRLRFSTYLCDELCRDRLPRMKMSYNYEKACPPGVNVNGIINILPDLVQFKTSSEVEYEFEKCLQNGNIYTFDYWVRSGRLVVDTDFLQVNFDIPVGMEWVPDCPAPFNLGGNLPIESSVTINPDGTQSVHMAFQLPFTKDSVRAQFCLRYVCQPGMKCVSDLPDLPPSGDDYTVYPPGEDCNGCRLALFAFTSFSVTPDQSLDCAVTHCNDFYLVVDDECNGGGGGGGGGGGLAGLAIVDYKTYRLNRGLQDNNDDRKADNNNKANAPGIRLDRYLVGDTMRTELNAVLIQGALSELSFRLFVEIWRSDFDTLDGDAFDIAFFNAKNAFTNRDSVNFLSANLVIKTASGQTYSCPLPKPAIISDRHLFTVVQPNVSPEQSFDLGASMFHQFDIPFDEPCFPPGFAMGPGDSLFFVTDFKFRRNYTPPASSNPPLINFRNALCSIDNTYAWDLNDFCLPKQWQQYSGFIEDITPNQVRIEPCGLSSEIEPFRYEMRIARGNMFPFEVRPLSTINNYSFSVPDVVAIDAIYLKALNLQENTLLIDSTGIPLYVKMGDSIIVLLDQFFQNPIDEGYVLTLNTRFDTLCQYDGTQFGRTNIDVQYVDECFRSPTTQRYHIKNSSTFISGSPELEAFPENTAFSLTENLIDFKFFLRNNATTTAQFAWLVLDSGGQMTDIELTYDPSGTPVPQIGGIYQLGDLPEFDLKRFRLKAKNLSCKTIVLKLRFGWDCVLVLNPSSSSCGVFEQEIIIRPLEPELELVIRSQPTSIPMCQPSAFWEFEVSNANDGTAFNVTPSIKLPPGFKVVPGSAQLSYPAGAPFVNMQDPVQTPGNVWFFDPEATSAQLAQTGLITAEMSPLNTLRIRFRVIAECGAVSNSQPIFGAEAVRPCGAYSNVLRKPGEPVRIDGVSVGAPAVLNLQFSNPPAQASCGQQVQFSASIAISETPKAGDSIYVLLPAGTSFVAGSYQAGANAPAGPPKVSGSQIQLPLPSNTVPGSVINFTFSIKYDDPAGCADKVVVMQTREKTSAFCASTNQFCDIYVATGEVVVSLNAQNPDYQLSNLTLVTQGGQTSVSALLNNAGTTVGNNPVVKIYFDQNGNGQVDTGEPLVATLNYNGSVIPNSSVLISGNVNNLPPNAFCSLLALIPADENCACDDRLYPLPGNQLITQGIGLCSLQTVTVGVPTSQGSTYQWLTPQGLSCTACSEATYTPGPNVKPGDLVTLVLQEKNGNCTIERRYEVQYGGSFGIETDDQTICEGSTAILQATLGGTSYNWSGPGITSPNQYNQVVQPTSTATYNVTVTFGGGCTGTGSVNIFVNKADQTILPALSTCEGQPISILGQVTDVPGIYTLKLQKKLTGCDSIISQELKVLATNTNASLPLCPGGVVTVFDEEVAAPANVCRTFTNSAGCDSTHCISVNLVPNPQLPGLDSAIIVAFGESAVIPTPGNFVTYEWIPYIPNVISCSNCPNPVVTPDTSTTFLLIVTDANGCRDSATYRVFVCNEQEVIVPNAFTPNGDGFNDVFRIVPHEGAEVVLGLRIYDRWGQKLYAGSGASAQWDGRIGDKPAPSDVYVWILEYECGGNRVRRSGDVTLLR